MKVRLIVAGSMGRGYSSLLEVTPGIFNKDGRLHEGFHPPIQPGSYGRGQITSYWQAISTSLRVYYILPIEELQCYKVVHRYLQNLIDSPTLGGQTNPYKCPTSLLASGGLTTCTYHLTT
jgi:hypothetical protein